MTAALVMVTFNRLSLLKETLAAYFEMKVRFEKIFIVDNHSTDGTEEYLRELSSLHPEVRVERQEKNIGGAGGFSRGVEIALQEGGADWLFLADDDAVPAEDMLQNLYMGYENAQNKAQIAAVCTSVISFESFDLSHRRVIKRGHSSLKCVTTPAHFEAPFFVDEASFVGLMVKSEVAKKIGLPNRELFIYFDDTDYSYRIRREGKILCLPRARIRHDARAQKKERADWRDYYATRNELYLLKTYYSKRFYKRKLFWDKVKKTSPLAAILRHRSKEERALFQTAIQDAERGNLGVHPVYRPQ